MRIGKSLGLMVLLWIAALRVAAAGDASVGTMPPDGGDLTESPVEYRKPISGIFPTQSGLQVDWLPSRLYQSRMRRNGARLRRYGDTHPAAFGAALKLHQWLLLSPFGGRSGSPLFVELLGSTRSSPGWNLGGRRTTVTHTRETLRLGTAMATHRLEIDFAIVSLNFDQYRASGRNGTSDLYLDAFHFSLTPVEVHWPIAQWDLPDARFLLRLDAGAEVGLGQLDRHRSFFVGTDWRLAAHYWTEYWKLSAGLIAGTYNHRAQSHPATAAQEAWLPGLSVTLECRL